MIPSGKGSVPEIFKQTVFSVTASAGFVPKLEIISKNISELRNVCVENYNWVYPTFQPNWMLPSSQIRAVPLKDPLYGSEYYLITTEDHTDDTAEMVRRFFQQTFSAD